MIPIETIILGFIQGVTEWIPVSSTGHLRISEYFLGLELSLFFDLILHMGTLAVTLFFFRTDIKKIIHSIYKWDFKTENGKMVPLIFIGTIPIAISGLLFSNIIDLYFNDILPISIAYIFCGIILFSSKRGNSGKNNLGYYEALNPRDISKWPHNRGSIIARNKTRNFFQVFILTFNSCNNWWF